MTPREINKINIAEFLASLNYFPEKKYHGYWVYKVMWRDQRTGSLKVDLRKGLWIDYSSNEGGTLIDLILKMYPSLSVAEIVQRFNRGDFSFHPLHFTAYTPEEKPSATILTEQDITAHPDLCSYLRKERGIDPLVASKYLSAYHYTNGQKGYWNLGAMNHVGGYNLFSKGFKRATKQGYTLYENSDSRSRIYFEGIIDFLSFLMIYPDQESVHEFCILNTVYNLKKTFATLRMKSITIGFFDNDKAGDKATEALGNEANETASVFYDYRKTYSSYKDLNDYLVGEVLSCKL